MSSVSNAATRSQLIIELTLLAIQSTNLNVLKFGMRVAENYTNTIAPMARVIDFHDCGQTVESANRASLANGKLIDNILKRVTRMPADLEEAWVASLPEPYSGELVRALAKRYQLAGTRMDDLTPARQLANLADVLSDAGASAVALAPIFRDGTIDEHDLPHLASALPIIERSIADFSSLHEQLLAQLPKPPTPKRIRPRRGK